MSIISDFLSDPWSDQNAQSWFLGGRGGGVPEVGAGRDSSDTSEGGGAGAGAGAVPVVGQNIDYASYQPSWQTQFRIKQHPDSEHSQTNNAHQQLLPELIR